MTNTDNCKVNTIEYNDTKEYFDNAIVKKEPEAGHCNIQSEHCLDISDVFDEDEDVSLIREHIRKIGLLISKLQCQNKNEFICGNDHLELLSDQPFIRVTGPVDDGVNQTIVSTFNFTKNAKCFCEIKKALQKINKELDCLNKYIGISEQDDFKKDVFNMCCHVLKQNL